MYLDPLTHAIIPAYQPLPTGAIRQDAKKGDEGARPAKGGAARAGDTCYDVYLDPLTHAIIPAYQPLPTGAIRQDAKKGDEGARPAKGGAARAGAPSPHAI